MARPSKNQPSSIVSAAPVADEEDAPVVDQSRRQYKLTAQAYIDDLLLEPSAVVYYDGELPGHHMQPYNRAAKEHCEKLWPNGRPEYLDPIQSMAIVGKPEETPEGRLVAAMAANTEALGRLLLGKAA